MRVMFLTNIPSPYRVVFFNMLGMKCDLTVVFESYTEKNRRWKVETGSNFKSVFLPGFSVATEFHINPSIIRHIKRYKYDVIIISGYSSPTDMMAISYLKRHKIPFIFSADGGFAKIGGNSLINDIKHYFISSANLYMSSGIMCDEYFKSHGINPNKIRRYNFSSITCSDLDAPLSLDARIKTLKKKYDLKEKVVISVGQFIKRKGFDILLDIWGHVRLNDVTLLLVGGGPQGKKYRKIIKEKNLKNVQIAGFLPRAKLFDLYRISDLFVFTTRYDIWGMTLSEAMACGLPVISSPNAASAHDLVHDGVNGYIENLHKPIAWARKIEEILEDEDLKLSYGRVSKRIMQDYTMEHMVSDYMKAIKEIMPRGAVHYENKSK